MVFPGGFEGMSNGDFLDTVDDLALTQRQVELDLLVAAQEWAARNSAESLRPGEDGKRGRQSMRFYGGQGTPKVASFAGAQFGVRMQRSPNAGDSMIADSLDLAHRLPELWGRVKQGEVMASYARFVARRTRELDPDAAANVDAQVAESADGRISWARFEALVEAMVKAADPEAARAREEKARKHQFAKRTRDITDGLACFLIRADVATIALLDATIRYIAQALRDLGVDGDSDRLRVLAVAVLANPAEATQLLAAYAEWKKQQDEQAASDSDHPDSGDQQDPADPEDPATDDPHDPDPAFDAPQDPDDDPTDAELVRRAITDLIALTGWRPDGSKPSVSWRRLLPRVQLIVHLYGGRITPDGRLRRFDKHGLARIEGHGTTVTEAWVRDVLGPMAAFTIRPVFDIAGQAPVDAWEIPDRHRQAVSLMTPADLFPYATASVNRPGGWQGAQMDHTERFAWDENGQPAKQGQSRIGNYSPMTQFHHNLKTHGAWDAKQPYPGIIIWRDPHGGYYVVDHTGTQRIQRRKTNVVIDITEYEPDAA